MATRWLNDKEWGCDVHVPMAKIPANIEKCWYCAQEWMGHRPEGDPPAKKKVWSPRPANESLKAWNSLTILM